VLPNVEELATVVVCEDDDPTRELLIGARSDLAGIQ
jgi:hypothetical protein